MKVPNPSLHPITGPMVGEVKIHKTGATLLDFYAAAALSGYMVMNEDRDFPPAKDIAPYIFDVAEWMLQERNKRLGNEN